MKKLLLFLIVVFTSLTALAVEKDTLSVADYIMGDLTVNKLIAAFFFCFLGLITSLLFDYLIGIVRDPSTKFNGKFWYQDNKKRILIHILLNIIIMFTVFVFFQEFSNKTLTMWHAWLIGISFDGVIIIIRRFTKVNVFQISKEKLSEIAQQDIN